MRASFVLAFALTALSISMAPSSASACSPACSGAVFPAGTDAAPAHLPANGAFVSVSAPGLLQLDVERTRAGATSTFTIDLSTSALAYAIPDAQPGDRLRIHGSYSCYPGFPATDITTVLAVTDTAPLPTALGVLEVEASRVTSVAVFDNRGGCTSDLSAAVAPYTLTLDASAVPWADAITLQPFVDGSSWYGVDDARVAPDFVFAHCAEPLPSQSPVSDTTPGEHRLRVQASLRGFDTPISTDEVPFELSCAQPSAGGCAVPATTGGLARTSTGALALLALAILVRRRRGAPRP